MKILISSAKTMNFFTNFKQENIQKPVFIEEAEQIAKVLKKYKPESLMKLMKISEKLALESFKKYEKWNKNFKNVEKSQAIYSFKGAVFEKINADNFCTTELDFAENSIRILCGLYGILKPKDWIMPYRLEMGTKLTVGNCKNLYDFWREKLTNKLIEELERDKTPFIINLASNEFSKVIDFKKINYPVITPVFKEDKEGTLKTISIFAKQARGEMTNFIVKNKITKINNLTKFQWNGYIYQSFEKNTMLFTRRINSK